MAFTSNLRGQTVIDDSNWTRYRDQVQIGDSSSFSSGYVARDYTRFGLTNRLRVGSAKLKKIPRADWAPMIEERERTKSELSVLHKHMRLRIMNQNGLGWCWCYGTVKAMQLAYARQGAYVPDLCAASLAAKIKGYRDEGGWAGEAIKGNATYGVSTTEFWPEHANDRRYDTAEQRENAMLHLIDEYEELESQSFDWVMSALLHGYPVTLGLMWWGHLVCGADPVVLGRNRFGVRIINSWDTTWEDGGMAILEESKAIPHEACVIRSVTMARA
jgi:hypothetical protein